mgnify:CR=1 FL=1
MIVVRFLRFLCGYILCFFDVFCHYKNAFGVILVRICNKRSKLSKTCGIIYLFAKFYVFVVLNDQSSIRITLEQNYMMYSEFEDDLGNTSRFDLNQLN